MSAIGFERHDHGACKSACVEQAEQRCKEAGLRFTEVRRRVLEILLEAHRAMGAYDILDRLRREKLGSQPPVVYRALDFLVSNGFAHKIERLNAFVACAHPNDTHAPAFLICRVCEAVAEASAANAALGKAADAAGFEIERCVVEALGVCPNCQPEEGA